MTKKHFIRIAEAFRKRVLDPMVPDVEMRELESLARDLAVIFADANPQFDRQRFLTACGF